MSFQEQTKDQIIALLGAAFQPVSLEVINDSAAHKNHAAVRDQPQAGHFKVIMTSEVFAGLSPVKRHRMVYEELKALMDSHIHALSMTLLAPHE